MLTYITPFTTSGVAFIPFAVYGSSVLSGIFLISSWSGDDHAHATVSALKFERPIWSSAEYFWLQLVPP